MSDLAVLSNTSGLIQQAIEGTPLERKNALRQIEQHPQPAQLLDQALGSLTHEDELQRHRVVKVIRKIILGRSDALFAASNDILEALQPMLLDQTHIARQQGRELLASLSAAVGLAQMFKLVREKLDSDDDYTRRLSAATLAALATTQYQNVILFICAAFRDAEPLARNTLLRSIAEICRVVPGAILSSLPLLVSVVRPELSNQAPQCRLSACAAITGLATACSPFGIESLEQCIPQLWAGTRTHRGKGLAWFIRALASLMPLMDPENAPEYAHSVLRFCEPHFDSPYDEIKKSVCRAISLADQADTLVLRQLIPSFFQHFWVRRLALDRQASLLILDATISLANAGSVLAEIIATNALKDSSSSPFQLLALDALVKIVTPVSIAAASERTQEQICDGLVVALRHSKTMKRQLIAAFGVFFNAMKVMLKPYIDPLVSTIVDCLNNPLAVQREMACLLVIPLAPAIKSIGDTKSLATLGAILNEQLGEDQPQVLTAVLQSIQAICQVMSLKDMQPPIGDLLPRLTPILRNKDDNIVQACIGLIGSIAQRGPEYATAREWMRICNELIEIFKAPRKSVRRMANNTFGYIAKGIGPQDVLASLLTSLKLERQSRVNAAVAMAIVADTCEPFTVLPALLNEYRSPSIHVQHGALKALAFVFEYTPAPQYLDSVVSLVDHALTSRNQVSRQTGAEIVKHLALKSIGHDYEEVFIHLLNELWPHIFETSPHVIDRIMQAVEAVQAVVGVGAIMPYIWAGMFHSARRTREVYWNLYNTAYVQSQHAMVAHYPVEVDAMDVWF